MELEIFLSGQDLAFEKLVDTQIRKKVRIHIPQHYPHSTVYNIELSCTHFNWNNCNYQSLSAFSYLKNINLKLNKEHL